MIELFRSSHQRFFIKKSCLKNFAIFTGKRRTVFLKNTCKRLLLTFAQKVSTQTFDKVLNTPSSTTPLTAMLLFSLRKSPNYHLQINQRSSHRRCSVRKDVPRNFAKFTGKHLCKSLLFNKVAVACSFIKNETLTQVLSC